MWRNATCAAGGLFVACAAVYMPSSAGFVAQTASFDARWLAIDPGRKSDRLDVIRESPATDIYLYPLPTFGTTVVIKRYPRKRYPQRLAPERNDKTDDVPRIGSEKPGPGSPARVFPQDVDKKEKMPVGCEPPFSPVIVPSMAHIVGRCLS